MAFERIVIETTGLADPVPILQALMTDTALAGDIEVDGVVTTVDAVTGAATLDRHPEAVKQAAIADRIVLTKTDMPEAEDLRAENWMGSVSDGTAIWYFPYKYQEYSPTETSKEYSKVIRLAEAYLIRAEARLRTNDFSGARDDLNHTRSRAGLPALSTLDLNMLEDALVYERKAEFFTEFGHRWFDLKRWGRAEALLENLKPGWGISSYLLPLPETELQANPNLLPQNPGY